MGDLLILAEVLQMYNTPSSSSCTSKLQIPLPPTAMVHKAMLCRKEVALAPGHPIFIALSQVAHPRSTCRLVIGQQTVRLLALPLRPGASRQLGLSPTGSYSTPYSKTTRLSSTRVPASSTSQSLLKVRPGRKINQVSWIQKIIVNLSSEGSLMLGWSIILLPCGRRNERLWSPWEYS